MEKSTANLVDTKKDDTPLFSGFGSRVVSFWCPPRSPLRGGVWGAFPNLLSYIRGISSLMELTP
jgi:hypothetical protein